MKLSSYFLLALLLSLPFVPPATAAFPSSEYVIPKETLSPSHRYGFTAPLLTTAGSALHNALVDLKQEKIITEVKAPPGFAQRANSVKIAPPWWNQEESLVLWQVDGKWSPSALVLIKFKNEKQVWQRDILTSMQQKILASTRLAAPQKYDAAQTWNRGNGTAYPDGFTVTVAPSAEYDCSTPSLKLPLKLHATLTSDPKGIRNAPQLHSEMDAIVTEEGSIKVEKFSLGN